MRTALAAAVLLCAAGGTAAAQRVDLAVKSAPVGVRAPSLRMRPFKQAAQAEPGPAGRGGGSSVAPATEIEAPDPGVPRSWRDAEERLIFKISTGYALDQSPTSGEPMHNGVVPGSSAPVDASGVGGRTLRQNNNYLLGDVVLGSRGVPYASLNTYFMSQFRLGLDGTSAYATHYDVWDSQDDAALLIYSGYAEASGLGETASPLHNVWLRAGRQFHYGAAAFATHFDGLQVAYEKPDWEAGAFFGRRVALYLDDDPGLLGGANLRIRFKRITGWPVSVAADFLEFDGERAYLELGSRIELGNAKLSFTARALDNGDDDGFGVGRFGARLRYSASQKLYLLADADYVLSHEVAYDYLSPNPTDVIATSGPALALPEPGDALRVGGGVMLDVTGGLELYGFGRANVASAVGFDNTWFEMGGAAMATLRSGLAATAQFRLRVHSLDEGTREPGSDFDDVSGSGVAGFREGSAELRYTGGYKKYTLALSGYLRIYDLRGPYVEIDGDARAGGRADVDYWFEKHTRVRFIGELAQPSQAFAPDLDNIFSFRMLAEASF